MKHNEAKQNEVCQQLKTANSFPVLSELSRECSENSSMKGNMHSLEEFMTRNKMHMI